MKVLEGLQPKNVFEFFETITTIPHGSKHTKAISDYCVSIAKEHGLEYYQDSDNNLIIIKEASKGYEQAKTVMLQGHLDMVTEKTSDSSHNFLTDSLPIGVDGDFIFSKDTTLGADNGIAVAYMLALLTDKEHIMPRIECVFTVDEEIGLLGADSIDLSPCKASYLINLDNEEDGVFITSCAGGIRIDLSLPIERKEVFQGMSSYQVKIFGLKGGHSGQEIGKERANAAKLMGRLLFDLQQSGLLEYELSDFEGGLKDNAIPRECTAIITSNKEQAEVEQVIKGIFDIYKKEYAVSDEQIDVMVTRCEDGKAVLTPSSKMKVLFFLNQLPNGVQHMDMSIEGLVETSLNLGITSMEENVFHANFSLRSSRESRKIQLMNQLIFLVEFLGGDFTTSGDYPGWEYNPNSTLRPMMTDLWKEMFQTEAKVEAIHAGLECGLLYSKMPTLDIVSIGPTMYDIHTPQERLSISSTKKCYEFVLATLERIAKEQ